MRKRLQAVYQKMKQQIFKKGKNRIVVSVFFVFSLLFFLAVCFLYTPWVQNSKTIQIYKIKKLLKDIPPTHPNYGRYKAILRCLQEGRCHYDFESVGLPPFTQ